MKDLTRREFVAIAASLGAALACAGQPFRSNRKRVERRDHFTEGVASGDPDFQSVLLWTRASLGTGDAVELTLEMSEDREFTRVVATATAFHWNPVTNLMVDLFSTVWFTVAASGGQVSAPHSTNKR